METVYLRALETGDLDNTHRWHNDPELYATLVGTFRFVSRSSEEEWLRRRAGYSTSEVSLAICLEEDSRHIGNAYISDIDWVSRHGEWALFIGEADLRGKGHGTAATQLLLAYAFGQLGLERLYSFCLADNRASIRMQQKLGFAVEGTMRRHAFKNHAFRDVVILGLCADAYRERMSGPTG